MHHKNKYHPHYDFQDAGTKKVKRIVSIIYICIMAFIVGGSYLHQQEQREQGRTKDMSGFSNP